MGSNYRRPLPVGSQVDQNQREAALKQYQSSANHPLATQYRFPARRRARLGASPGDGVRTSAQVSLRCGWCSLRPGRRGGRGA